MRGEWGTNSPRVGCLRRPGPCLLESGPRQPFRSRVVGAALPRTKPVGGVTLKLDTRAGRRPCPPTLGSGAASASLKAARLRRAAARGRGFAAPPLGGAASPRPQSERGVSRRPRCTSCTPRPKTTPSCRLETMHALRLDCRSLHPPPPLAYPCVSRPRRVTHRAARAWADSTRIAPSKRGILAAAGRLRAPEWPREPLRLRR